MKLIHSANALNCIEWKTKLLFLQLIMISLCDQGVFTGELDPTPIKKPGMKNDEIEIPTVWDLMMNKKPNRKSRR